jgi:hypothetical protein
LQKLTGGGALIERGSPGKSAPGSITKKAEPTNGVPSNAILFPIPYLHKQRVLTFAVRASRIFLQFLGLLLEEICLA